MSYETKRVVCKPNLCKMLLAAKNAQFLLIGNVDCFSFSKVVKYFTARSRSILAERLIYIMHVLSSSQKSGACGLFVSK